MLAPRLAIASGVLVGCSLFTDLTALQVDAGPGDVALPEAGADVGADAGPTWTYVNPCGALPCAPIVVAGGQGGPRAVAVSDAAVFWTTDSFVDDCPIGGCATNPGVRAMGLLTPEDIVMRGSSAFTSETGDILRLCIPAGCQSPIATIAGDQGLAIATDATQAFWSTSGGVIYACPLTGCGSSPTALAMNQDAPNGVAVDATYVYWANVGPSGTINRCEKTGCAGQPFVLASGESQLPFQATDVLKTLAADGTSVFWTNASAGTVVRSTPDGAQTTLVTNQPTPLAIAVDTTNVYWANTDGTIMVCGKVGCAAPVQLAAGQGVSNLAVDAANLYWANPGDGSVRQLRVR